MQVHPSFDKFLRAYLEACLKYLGACESYGARSLGFLSFLRLESNPSNSTIKKAIDLYDGTCGLASYALNQAKEKNRMRCATLWSFRLKFFFILNFSHYIIAIAKFHQYRLFSMKYRAAQFGLDQMMESATTITGILLSLVFFLSFRIFARDHSFDKGYCWELR